MIRVVVTGLGLVTPVGPTAPLTWQRMLEGRSGIRTIARFDASPLPVRIAGEVCEEWTDDETDPSLQRHSRYALTAAREALASAALDPGTVDPERFGVFLGSGDGTMPHGPVELAPVFARCASGDKVDLSRLEAASRAATPAGLVRESDCMMPAAHLALRVGARGPNRTCLTACAASSQALGEALRTMQYGDADVILAGGSQALVTLEGLVGFTLLNALSKRNDDPARASRPFDQERDGFVLAEGAGILVLETLDHARRRGAPVLAELLGYGASADAFRVTDPHPEGEGAVLCMRRAVADSGVEPSRVTYVNAHGTSTKANDASESVAVGQVFAPHRPAVTSNKSQLGHLIAAAGAVELATCVLSIRDGVIPPTINHETHDASCDLDLVANTARRGRVDCVISNSFGFGGQNVSLVVGPPPA